MFSFCLLFSVVIFCLSFGKATSTVSVPFLRRQVKMLSQVKTLTEKSSRQHSLQRLHAVILYYVTLYSFIGHCGLLRGWLALPRAHVTLPTCLQESSGIAPDVTKCSPPPACTLSHVHLSVLVRRVAVRFGFCWNACFKHNLHDIGLWVPLSALGVGGRRTPTLYVGFTGSR